MHITKDNWKINLQEFVASDEFKMHSQSDFQNKNKNKKLVRWESTLKECFPLWTMETPNKSSLLHI